MGSLYIIATPIGNLDDITLRAIKTLFSVEFIACEDTRRTGLLLKNLEDRIQSGELRINGLSHRKKPQLISFYDEVEYKKIPDIIELLEQDKDAALVSDAGTPLIADPGYKLIQACISNNIKIIPIPGPSALTTALSVSGLPTNQVIFLGYLPAKRTKRLKLLKTILIDSRPRVQMAIFTIVIFESPHRLHDCLTDLKEVLGGIEIVILRELTKIHEEIIRGKISDTIFKTADLKGEIVILFRI